MSAPRRLVAGACWATLAAGVCGAVRQRAEGRAVRAGRLAPLGPAGRAVPPTREDPVSARVAGWLPARPLGPVARAVAAAWAAPLSLVGLALGATTGGRARWNAEHGCVVFAAGRGQHGGLAGRLRALVGAEANAVGQVVLARSATSSRLLAHEAAHVRQAERLGTLLPVLYAWWWASHGHRAHPLERAARQAARREELTTPA